MSEQKTAGGGVAVDALAAGDTVAGGSDACGGEPSGWVAGRDDGAGLGGGSGELEGVGGVGGRLVVSPAGSIEPAVSGAGDAVGSEGGRPAGTWGPRSPTTPPNSSRARRRSGGAASNADASSATWQNARPLAPRSRARAVIRDPQTDGRAWQSSGQSADPSYDGPRQYTGDATGQARSVGARSTTRPSRRVVLRRPLPYAIAATIPPPRIAGGGGGIRTHEAFARRFSRPLPSTTRPPLRGAARVARSRCGVGVRDGAATTWRRCARWCGAGPGQAVMRSVRMYGRRTSGTSTDAVRLLVGLEDRRDDPGQGQARAVERVDELRLGARLGPVADRHPAGLEVAEVRARADLEPALHARRPDLEVVLAAWAKPISRVAISSTR